MSGEDAGGSRRSWGSPLLVSLLVAALLGCGREVPTPTTPTSPAAAAQASCDNCGRRLEPGHDCLPFDRCLTCGRDVRRGHQCAVTSICRLADPERWSAPGGPARTPGDTGVSGSPWTSLRACTLFEVGREHRHGVTQWCASCRSEVAENHMRNELGRCLTRFCGTCPFDAVRPDSAERLLRAKVLHVCGVTHYCPKCMTEVAENHVCDVTRYCAICKRDVSFPYCEVCRAVLGANRGEKCTLLERLHPVDGDGAPLDPGPIVVPCARCKKDVRARDHVCFVTEFCPRCRREAPLEHSDEE